MARRGILSPKSAMSDWSKHEPFYFFVKINQSWCNIFISLPICDSVKEEENKCIAQGLRGNIPLFSWCQTIRSSIDMWWVKYVTTRREKLSPKSAARIAREEKRWFLGRKKGEGVLRKGGDDLCCTFAFPLFSTPLSSPLSCIFPIVKTDVNAFGDHKLLKVKELFGTRKEFCTMFLVWSKQR